MAGKWIFVDIRNTYTTTNHNEFTLTTPGTLSNLVDEDGTATGIDITLPTDRDWETPY